MNFHALKRSRAWPVWLLFCMQKWCSFVQRSYWHINYLCVRTFQFIFLHNKIVYVYSRQITKKLSSLILTLKIVIMVIILFLLLSKVDIIVKKHKTNIWISTMLSFESFLRKYSFQNMLSEFYTHQWNYMIK